MTRENPLTHATSLHAGESQPELVQIHEGPTSKSIAPPVLGVLGAGQLAQMLTQAAKKLGFVTRVLAESPSDPAAPVADQVVYGKATDHSSLVQVFEGADWVAIESELIHPSILDYMDASGLSARLRPRSQVIARFSDKLLQKKGLVELDLPTLPWEELTSFARDPSSCLTELGKRFPRGYVLKWARGGYDGHGVLRVATPAQLDGTKVSEFVTEGLKRGGSVYAEELCPFSSELAVIATRSITGDFAAYPVVVTFQDQGICSEVLGPAKEHGVDPQAIEDALDVARKVGEGFGLVGTYAVEFFLHEGGVAGPRVVVNEIAPRVHNSGHFSQDAAATSQFENHWRGMLGMPLGATESAPFFAMVNILGPEGKSGAIHPPDSVKGEGITLHWYGKAESRPRRKIGHVNIHGQSRKQVEVRLKLVRAQLKSWAEAWALS
jgi:5-(carboxyamino)imidazole ribonucleotide synthase